MLVTRGLSVSPHDAKIRSSAGKRPFVSGASEYSFDRLRIQRAHVDIRSPTLTVRCAKTYERPIFTLSDQPLKNLNDDHRSSYSRFA